MIADHKVARTIESEIESESESEVKRVCVKLHESKCVLSCQKKILVSNLRGKYSCTNVFYSKSSLPESNPARINLPPLLALNKDAMSPSKSPSITSCTWLVSYPVRVSLTIL